MVGRRGVLIREHSCAAGSPLAFRLDPAQVHVMPLRSASTAIDTNALLRLLARDDRKQTALAEEFVAAALRSFDKAMATLLQTQRL